MKPLGRRYYKCKTGSKHILRIDGKYHCWWSDVVEPSKRYEQRVVDDKIKVGEQLYYDYIEDALDGASGGCEGR
jgi:hypothetical protein